MRLEKERNLTEEEVEKMDAEFKAEHGGAIPTTTAAAGAPIEEVKAGVEEVKALKAAALKEDAVAEGPVDPAIVPPVTVP